MSLWAEMFLFSFCILILFQGFQKKYITYFYLNWLKNGRSPYQKTSVLNFTTLYFGIRLFLSQLTLISMDGKGLLEPPPPSQQVFAISSWIVIMRFNLVTFKPILPRQGRGALWPPYHESIGCYRAVRARFTKFHDFVSFGNCQDHRVVQLVFIFSSSYENTQFFNKNSQFSSFQFA